MYFVAVYLRINQRIEVARQRYNSVQEALLGRIALMHGLRDRGLKVLVTAPIKISI